MKSVTSSSSSYSSVVDEKIELPIESKATSASLFNSQFTKVRTILGKGFSRAAEWMQGLPSDRRMLVEFNAWEQTENGHAQLVANSDYPCL